MAKKKSAAEVKEAAAAKGKRVFENDSVSTMICKTYGDVIEEGNIVLEQLSNYQTLSVSPAIDFALAKPGKKGGFKEGTVVIMTGPPKAGKTTTALHFAAKCQKLGRFIVYFNTEERLALNNFEGIKGLDAGSMKIVQSTDEKPIVTAEDYLNILETYIKNTKNLVAIVDSTSNMVPADVFEGKIRTGIRPSLPGLLSQFFKRTAGDVRRNRSIIILITHAITDTNKKSLFAPDTKADGGVMQQYQNQTNLLITGTGNWTAAGKADDESGEPIGQKVFWKVVNSCTGGVPNTKQVGWIRYGIGIDEAQEIAIMGVELSVIIGQGWYTIQPLVEMRLEKPIAKWLKANEVDPENEEAVSKFVKFQGMAKLTEFISKNEFIIPIIQDKIRELFS